MSKSANLAGHGTRPSGSEAKTYTTRASTRASSYPNTRSQPVQPTSSKVISAHSASSHQPESSIPTDQAEVAEQAIIVHKEVILAFGDIADRLNEICKTCTSVSQFKKTIAALVKHMRKAAKIAPETVIQLSDPKSVKDEITADLTKWRNDIDYKFDVIGTLQKKILEATTSFTDRANGLHSVAKELEGQISKVAVASDKIANNAAPYQDALLGGTRSDYRNVVDKRVLIDIDHKAKQIMLIIKDHDTALLNPEELANKANGIIDKIIDPNCPETVKVDLVVKFQKGGALFHYNSKEAVKWIRQPEIKDAFLQKFDKDAYVKECQHSVLLRGVPIILDPSKEANLREIEEVNGLAKFSIVKARWIKPEGRRQVGQTHAHSTAIIASANIANSIIKDGMEICGVKIRPEKLKQEPLQCLRCRRWGHFAANCFEPTDTCGTCGDNHRTASCSNPEKKHCVSCNTDSYTSWDRKCPEFIRWSKIHDNNHPENNMVYFPTEENWTLTTRPDRVPLEERFPPQFAVNNIQITSKKPHVKNKRVVPTRQIASKSTQGKDQNTINQYFSRTLDKGKGKAVEPEKDDLQTTDDYEEFLDIVDYNNVERLLGSPFHRTN